MNVAGLPVEVSDEYLVESLVGPGVFEPVEVDAVGAQGVWGGWFEAFEQGIAGAPTTIYCYCDSDGERTEPEVIVGAIVIRPNQVSMIEWASAEWKCAGVVSNLDRGEVTVNTCTRGTRWKYL